MALSEENQRKYDNRMARLQDLIRLHAPAYIIARECLLIAGAVFDIPDLIERVENMTEASTCQ